MSQRRGMIPAMNRYRQYQEPQRRRINARPQNDPWVAAGATGLHRDTSGNVIGGYNGEGVSFGSKVRGGGARTPSQPAGGTAPATGNVLNSRINLFKEMEKAGADGITEEMRKKARSLGVADESFNTAVGKIRTNAAATAPTPQEPGSRNPPQPPNQEAPTAPPAPRPEAPRVGKINGRPAGEVLGEMRSNPQYETAPRYGAEIGKANIKSMGIDGAIADYYKRSGQDNQNEVGAKWKTAAGGNSGSPVTAAGESAAKVPASPANSPTPSPALADTGKVDMPDIGKIAGNLGSGIRNVADKAVGKVKAGIGAISSAVAVLPKPTTNAAPPSPVASWKTPPSYNPTVVTINGKKQTVKPGIKNSDFVNLEAPFKAMGKTYRKEQNRGYKTPLRSAAIAGVAGVKTLGREILGRQ